MPALRRRPHSANGLRVLLFSALPWAHAQEASPSLPQVLVLGDLERGAVQGDIPPLVQIDPPEIESFGVASVADVLTELQPETQSSRGRSDAAPVLLLNGRRISTDAEVRDIPAEALERVEVFPEDLALRYGYAADQKVVNFVVRERFRALTTEAEGDLTSQGGGETAKGSLDYLRLTQGGRLNLALSFEQDDLLRESQRGMDTTIPGSPFDLIGNLTAPGSAAGGQIDPGLSALAGQTVTVAGVPVLPPGVPPSLAQFVAGANQPRVTDLSPYRSLRPDTQKVHLNAVDSWTMAGGIYAAVSAGLDLTNTRALQGLASASLVVPAGDPYSPFSSTVQLDRLLGELGPLSQDTDGAIYHLGFSLDGTLHRWTWSMTGSAQHASTRTTTETGVDLDAAQALLDAGNAALDPFTPLAGSLLRDRIDDVATGSSDTGTLQWVTQGTVRDLPAGPLATSLKLGDEASRIDAAATIAGSAEASSLFRNVASGQMNLDIPLTSRAREVLGPVGDLAAFANLTLQQVSDYGTLRALAAGLNWSPSGHLYLDASGTDDQAAPSLTMLSSPIVQTPNVPVFDYVSGQSVSVTQTSGGNPSLLADHREQLSLNLNYRPLLNRNLWINAGYLASDTHDLSGPLAVASAAAQAAFPDRFERDASGALIAVDDRPVNFLREQRQQLRWGFNSYWPLSGGSGAPTSVQLAVHDTWFIRDTILIRAGLPEVDLLDGGTIGASGGQPRAQIDLQGGVTMSGIGLRINERWRGPSSVLGGSSSADLNFGALMTVNLRLFANLGDTPALRGRAWSHGLRVVLAADNAFNQHQRVLDASGAVPSAYQSAYLDPLGRVIRLDLRKVF